MPVTSRLSTSVLQAPVSAPVVARPQVVAQPAVTFVLSFSGGMTASGAFAKQQQRYMTTGNLTASATFTRKSIKGFAGGLAASATLAKQTAKAFAGGMTAAGSQMLQKVLLKPFSGGMTGSGNFSKIFTPGGGASGAAFFRLLTRRRR